MNGTPTQTQRIVLLATNIVGDDGIATVTRHAIGCWNGVDGRFTEAWSLLDEDKPLRTQNHAVAIRNARGSRARFVSWGLRSGMSRQSHSTILAMHLAVAPVALPLVVRGARLAVFLHGVEAWRRVRRRETIALRRADLLIANSHHTADGFRSANPEFVDREIDICPLGVDVSDNEIQSALSPMNEASQFALIVGRISSAERYKGHDQLIDLWPSIVVECPEASLIVAGDGDDRSRLESKVAALGMADHIRFAGRVSELELQQLYSKCRFFAMPSRGEGFGLVFLEAMRAGRACLGGIGAASEVIEDGVTGYVVNPADSGAIRSAVHKMFRNVERTEVMGREGRRRFMSHFTARHFRQRLRSILDAPKAQA